MLAPDDLARVTAETIRHYQERADAFWAGTRDHDVRQNIDALLRHIEGPPPFRILDFGCGPGRDLATFKTLGHLAIGLEGAPSFAAMARAHSGCEVWEQDFLSLDLPPAMFDGVFANASLFHVPTQELARVLGELRATLKAGGVLFCSNPRGENQEGWERGLTARSFIITDSLLGSKLPAGCRAHIFQLISDESIEELQSKFSNPA